MTEQSFRYVIIGAGLAGGSAVEGIREIDKDGPILLIGNEKHLPYHRPPLTKKLWGGKKKLESIFLHDDKWFVEQKVTTSLATSIERVDAVGKTVIDSHGPSFGFEKLLLATGGAPRKLAIPGGDLEGVCYFRYVDDFTSLRAQATPGASAVIIGGGFIGTELAAALNSNKLRVTLVQSGPHICHKVFPADLAKSIEDNYRAKGVELVSNEQPVTIARRDKGFVVTLRGGRKLECDILAVGIGISPSDELAKTAGLKTEDGVVVDEHLQTSQSGIYAAGDVARFPYQALDMQMRVEHWDNAISQGKLAGRNMAGAGESYTHMPYFYSDLFEFGYEAVGEIDSRLNVVADWKDPYKTGVLYYLREDRLRGAMMCNVWDKVPVASDMIRSGLPVTPQSLKGAITN